MTFKERAIVYIASAAGLYYIICIYLQVSRIRRRIKTEGEYDHHVARILMNERDEEACTVIYVMALSVVLMMLFVIVILVGA